MNKKEKWNIWLKIKGLFQRLKDFFLYITIPKDVRHSLEKQMIMSLERQEEIEKKTENEQKQQRQEKRQELVQEKEQKQELTKEKGLYETLYDKYKTNPYLMSVEELIKMVTLVVEERLDKNDEKKIARSVYINFDNEPDIVLKAKWNKETKQTEIIIKDKNDREYSKQELEQKIGTAKAINYNPIDAIRAKFHTDLIPTYRLNRAKLVQAIEKTLAIHSTLQPQIAQMSIEILKRADIAEMTQYYNTINSEPIAAKQCRKIENVLQNLETEYKHPFSEAAAQTVVMIDYINKLSAYEQINTQKECEILAQIYTQNKTELLEIKEINHEKIEHQIEVTNVKKLVELNAMDNQPYPSVFHEYLKEQIATENYQNIEMISQMCALYPQGNTNEYTHNIEQIAGQLQDTIPPCEVLTAAHVIAFKNHIDRLEKLPIIKEEEMQKTLYATKAEFISLYNNEYCSNISPTTYDVLKDVLDEDIRVTIQQLEIDCGIRTEIDYSFMQNEIMSDEIVEIPQEVPFDQCEYFDEMLQELREGYVQQHENIMAKPCYDEIEIEL